jgi:hypothetical protein
VKAKSRKQEAAVLFVGSRFIASSIPGRLGNLPRPETGNDKLSFTHRFSIVIPDIAVLHDSPESLGIQTGQILDAR